MFLKKISAIILGVQNFRVFNFFNINRTGDKNFTRPLVITSEI